MTALRRALSRLRTRRARDAAPPPSAPVPPQAKVPAATRLLTRFLQPAYDLRDWRLLAAARELVRLPSAPEMRPAPVRVRSGRPPRA